MVHRYYKDMVIFAYPDQCCPEHIVIRQVEGLIDQCCYILG